jgi:glycogen operon protein
MNHFRKAHPAISRDSKERLFDFPSLSVHANKPWEPTDQPKMPVFALLFAGIYGQKEDLVYFVLNVHWEDQEIFLPDLPATHCWKNVVNTGALEEKDCFIQSKEERVRIHKSFVVKPRSVAIFVGTPINEE